MLVRQELIRVRWIDTDASGRIHFTAVFRWVEAAEIELFRELGLMDDRDRYPRRRVAAEYLLPINFDDEIVLNLQLDAAGRTSLSFTWEASRDDKLVARGDYTIVYVDEEGRPCPVRDELRSALSAHA